MKNSRLKQFLAILTLLLVIYPSFPAQAKVQNFSSIYMELTLPDDAIVLTKDTPNTDAKWKEVGVTDIKKEKNNFDMMGVQALIYDPNTKTSVHILQKRSKTSKDIFHLSLLSDTELKDFLNTFAKIDDKNTTYTIEKYPQKETPFFRFALNVTKNGISYSEIIYATIVNGNLISFDNFQQNNKTTIDESFLKELVAGTHFTEFMDKAEFEKDERNFTIASTIILFIIASAIILWILLSKKRRKRLSTTKSLKAQELSKFYTEQRLREEQNVKDTPKFENHTAYSEAVVKQFTIYDRFIHPLKVWVISILLFLIFVVSLYAAGSFVSMLIAIVLFIVFLYFQGFQFEKSVNKTMKNFEKNKTMEAVYTFYDDYYTLSGIQSTSKYPYIQITEVKEYKDYIYIYLGADKAHYLKKDGFEKGFDEFKKIMKGRI